MVLGRSATPMHTDHACRVMISCAVQDLGRARWMGDVLRARGLDVEVRPQPEAQAGPPTPRRTPIETCAVFIPVISQQIREAATALRAEWKCAEAWARRIGAAGEFVIPVCIDATRESSVGMPELLRVRAWLRLRTDDDGDALCDAVVGAIHKREALDRSRQVPAIPDYELLRPIGEGAYGEVWLARGVTGILRAIKVVRRDRFAESGPFEREFHGLRDFTRISLDDRAQLALLHVGRSAEGSFFYYVMELADDAAGVDPIDPDRYVPLTLARWMHLHGRMPAAQCIVVAVALARVLAGLHAHGLVHRDIKPSNVIFVGGAPKLADVGLVARAAEARTVIGTEGYMPPEGAGAPAGDVFALGKVLYELTTGEDCHQFPALPRDLRQFADWRTLLKVNEVVLRACSPRPDQRYSDAAAMLADLQRISADDSGPRRRQWAWGAVAVLACSVIVAASVMSRAHERSKTTGPESVSHLPPIVPPLLDKSIVVLPLENLSTDPDNAFFADGVHAEIIGALGRIPGLSVIARHSALAYRNTRKTLGEIGNELAVGNVILGNVRRQQDRVRVQIELRRARDGSLLWARDFDRQVSDVFAVQADIAGDVARILKVRTAVGTESTRISARDPIAYDLFLRATEPVNEHIGRHRKEDLQTATVLLEEAVRRDPAFPEAVGALSVAHAMLCAFYANDLGAREKHARQARQWAERAAELEPGGGGVSALCYFTYLVERDGGRALALAERYLEACPNDPEAYALMDICLQAIGRCSDTVPYSERAIVLNPRNLVLRLNLEGLLASLRRRDAWYEAAAAYGAMAQSTDKSSVLVETRYLMDGELPPSVDELDYVRDLDHLGFLWWSRRFPDVLEYARSHLEAPETDDIQRFEYLCRSWDAMRRLGRVDEAVSVLQELARVEGKLRPLPEIWMEEKERRAAAVAIRAQRFDEAVASGRCYVESFRVPDQQEYRWHREAGLALLYAQAGRHRECVELVAKLLRVPSLLSVRRLRVDPDWDVMRGVPEYEALLVDPANDAPM